jgi:hypothetical protein
VATSSLLSYESVMWMMNCHHPTSRAVVMVVPKNIERLEDEKTSPLMTIPTVHRSMNNNRQQNNSFRLIEEQWASAKRLQTNCRVLMSKVTRQTRPMAHGHNMTMDTEMSIGNKSYPNATAKCSL